MRRANNEKRKTRNDEKVYINQIQKKSERLEKWNHTNSCNVGSRYNQTSGDEKAFKKEYFRRTRKLLETKLHSRNLIKGLNTRVVFILRYSGPFLKRMKELQEMNERT